MILDSIELLSFRNFSHLLANFNPNFNIFIGPNGAGKTNLLEAIYLLSNGELKRGKREVEAIKWNDPFTWIRGEVEYEDGRLMKLVTQIRIEGGKDFSINGKIVSLRRYLGSFPTVSIFDDDQDIITGGPDRRRKFLDDFVISIDPEYYSILNSYKGILTRRNKVLRTKNTDKKLLEALTELLLDYGEKIIASRYNAVSVYNRYLDREGKKFSLEIRVEIPSFKEDIQKSIQFYRDRFNLFRRKEETIGITLIGPHREDIIIRINGKDSRSFASNGEIQIILFLLKVAQFEIIRETKGYKPVFLIDEFLGRLDDKNSRFIMDLIEEKSPQIFTTMLFKRVVGKSGSIFTIDNGEIIDEEAF